MSFDVYMGIDNGVSGSIGAFIEPGVKTIFFKTPTFKQEDYQSKNTRKITRVDVIPLVDRFRGIFNGAKNVYVVIERPMVNPTRFFPSMSAIRAFEATLIALNILQVNNIKVIDSKVWQAKIIPGVKGSDNLKRASMEWGVENFDEFSADIRKHGDADSLAIALWAKNNWGVNNG